MLAANMQYCTAELVCVQVDSEVQHYLQAVVHANAATTLSNACRYNSFCCCSAAVTEPKTCQLNDSYTSEIAMTANQVTQLTMLQVSAAVIEAGRIDLQQHAAIQVSATLYCSSFQCSFII